MVECAITMAWFERGLLDRQRQPSREYTEPSAGRAGATLTARDLHVLSHPAAEITPGEMK